MAKAAPIINAFTSGEFSPLMAGRTDVKFYSTALRRIRNFILAKQGPARRRPGTRFVAEVKTSANRTWLFRFEFNVEQAYILEFGHQYIRFFANHGVVESAPSVPLEVVTPYAASDLIAADGTFALRFVQSNDVMYIVHPNFAPRKLTRLGAASFSLSTVAFDGGPFKDLDPATTITVFAGANTGTGVTLTASATLFQSTHVGELFYLEQKNINGILQWEAAKVIALNDIRQNDGKNYKALNAATTGTVAPTHSSGALYDGNAGVQWQFLDPGYGWGKIATVPAQPAAVNVTNAVNNGSGLIRITATAHGRATGDPVIVASVGGVPNANGTWISTVVDANTIDLQGTTFAGAYTSGGTVQLVAGCKATIDILSRLPDQAVGVANASTNWAHGAWSDLEGWPSSVTFFRERLCFSRNQFVWQSVTGDFENFSNRDSGGVVVADAAITSDVTSDRANRVEWIAPSDNGLLCGTAGDEHLISEITQAQALGPGNVKARKQSNYGSKHVPPARIGDGLIMVQKAGRKLRELAYSWEKQGYQGLDLTVLAEHVTKTGVIDMAYQQEPDSVLWCVRADGQLAAFTLDREQEIHGWHPHRIGGYSDANVTQYAVVESVSTIPSPDGGRDETWFIVRRYINGATKRYVEWIETIHEEGDDPDDVFHVDGGLTLNNVKNAVLTPGTGANVKGSTGVNFQATAMFSSGDVGKRIHYRYSLTDIKGKIKWYRAVAEITAFVDVNNVTCTVYVPWPNLNTVAANGWRMTVTTVTGLGHLEGQTVQVWANGSAHPDCVVTGGSIALNRPASKVHVGLACPAILQPMIIEAGAADGTAQGKTARISRCIIRFHETMGCKYGRDEDLKLDQVMNRGGGDAMDESTELFTGDKTVAWPDGYDQGALITILQDLPGPVTLIALMPQTTVQDNR